VTNMRDRDTSTFALTDTTLSYALELADRGIERDPRQSGARARAQHAPRRIVPGRRSPASRPARSATGA
jgi:hypothetical protein